MVNWGWQEGSYVEKTDQRGPLTVGHSNLLRGSQGDRHTEYILLTYSDLALGLLID